VTTIFAKRVGRPVVSAMTQTPASGPLALVTEPEMSAPLNASWQLAARMTSSAAMIRISSPPRGQFR